jgi:sugar/nucleoside kinase (ribokinase family)
LAWELAVAGTVTLDDVTTPAGRRRDQRGGSAVYFALAASRFAPVHLAGIVEAGDGGAVRALLRSVPIDLEGLEGSELPTFRWRAVHDFERWVTAEEETEEGAYAGWRPRLPPAAASAEVLFVGSMRPSLQLSILEQSRGRFIGADSMTVFIGSDGDEVGRVAESADILFLNRAELSALTGEAEDAWQRAARSLCGRGRLRAVVVKAGPLGAACVSAGDVLEMEAHPVRQVVDPTGAGDALAGGFLGACARAERDDEGFFAEALGAGIRCAADAISTFGTAGLLHAPAGAPDERRARSGDQ